MLAKPLTVRVRALYRGLVGGRWRLDEVVYRDHSEEVLSLDDGSLHEVIEYYATGGAKNPTLDPKVRALHLSPLEKTDLVAFLNSLNGKKFKKAGNLEDYRPTPHLGASESPAPDARSCVLSVG